MKEKEVLKELNLVSASKSSKRVVQFSMIVVVLVTVMHLVHYIFLNKQINNLESRIVYIDSNGLTGTGEIRTMKDIEVLKIQMEAAIKYAIPYMYSFNSANYDDNIEHGLVLFGQSGKEIHQSYINENVRESVFNNNLEVYCEIIDPVEISLSDKKTAIVTFIQTVNNGNVSQERKFKANMTLIETEISKMNPFGYLIEDWVVKIEE